jgi:hypothetical protein
MGRWKASWLVLAACGAPRAPGAKVDPFEDDPVSTLGTLEQRLAGASVIDVEGTTSAGVAGLVHIEKDRVSYVKVTAPRFAKWSSLQAHAKDTDPTVWADSLDKELLRVGLAPTWDAVLRGADPDTFTGDVDGVLTVDQVAWRDDTHHTLELRVTDERDGVTTDVALELDARGLPLRRAANHEVETYSKFEVLQ